MENQCQLVWNHEITIDGVKFIELKEFKDMSNNDYWIVHTRAIGDSRYSILHLINKENGEVKEENTDTNMNDSQLAEFNNDWNDFITTILNTLQVQPFLLVHAVCDSRLKIKNSKLSKQILTYLWS